MKQLLSIALLAICSLSLFAVAPDGSTGPTDEAKRVDDATVVLDEFAGMSEGIPGGLAENAAGVVVVPGLLKAGFMVGGKHGSGVLSIKGKDGNWSEPVFVKMTGGSIGWQIGASSTDLVLFFMNENNIQGVLDGEFTLGGNASVAAGPVGRTGSADTSAKLDAEIYSYSRSRGAFAGVSIDGSKLYVDESANKVFYGDNATPTSIVAMAGKSDSHGGKFRTALAKLTQGSAQ